MQIPGWVRALATSRKFWLSVIVAVAAIVLFARGQITAEQLTDALVALATVLVLAIAGEDIAAKAGSARSQ